MNYWIILALIASLKDSAYIKNGEAVRHIFAHDCAYSTKANLEAWIGKNTSEEFYFGPVIEDGSLYLTVERNTVISWVITDDYSVLVTSDQVVVSWWVKSSTPDAPPDVFLSLEEKTEIVKQAKHQYEEELIEELYEDVGKPLGF